MEILYFFIAVTAFCFGFFLGKNKRYKPCIKANKNTSQKIAIDRIKEYENFLNYDGSEQ